MSTLTQDQFAEILRQRLELAPNDGPRLEILVPDALRRMPDVLRDSVKRHFLTSQINKTPIAGVVDLTDAAFVNVLIDTYREAGAINTQAETSVTFYHAPSLDALKVDTPKDLTAVWYHLRSPSLLVFKNPVDNALNTYAVPVALLGLFIPTLNTLRDELNTELVDRMEELFKGLGGAQFLRLDPERARAAVNELGRQPNG